MIETFELLVENAVRSREGKVDVCVEEFIQNSSSPRGNR